MKKKITIAITGHRDIVETEELREKVSAYFDGFLDKSKELTLFSPLADGADRFVAKIFLEKQKKHQHLRLVVPMPFSKERYLLDFSEASQKEFLALSDQAAGSFQIPSMGDSPYRELGKYISHISDELLALWDGTFNGKVGGTGDVLEYARHMGKEVVHFVCERENNGKYCNGSYI